MQAEKIVDPNKKHYFNPVPFDQVKNILKRITDLKMDVSIWEKSSAAEDSPKTEIYESLLYDSENHILHLKMKGSFLAKMTGTSFLNKDVLFKTNIDKVYYFSNGVLKQNPKTGDYCIELTDKFFAGQQRTNYRLSASEHIHIDLVHAGETISCCDVSAGGASFITKIEDKDKFAKGSLLFNLVLIFNKQQYKIPQARVMSVQDQLRSGKEVIEVKIGIKFEQIPDKAEEILCQHINSEARVEDIRRTLL